VQAYDIAACKFRGPEAVTNFNIRNYDVHLSQLAQVSLQLRSCQQQNARRSRLCLRCACA